MHRLTFVGNEKLFSLCTELTVTFWSILPPTSAERALVHSPMEEFLKYLAIIVIICLG